MSAKASIYVDEYDDFCRPAPARNFKLIAGPRVFYVNAGWLAEHSPFFEDYCFADVHAPREYVVDDISHSDLLEFLRCICYCPSRKPITVSNVSLILRIASKFEMRAVVARCESFVAKTAPTLDRNRLFQVTCAMSHYDPDSTTMSVLVDRLSSAKKEDLCSMPFGEMPGNVVADVFNQRMRAKEKRRKRWCCCISWYHSLVKMIRDRRETGQASL